jgi:hypothetical protein
MIDDTFARGSSTLLDSQFTSFHATIFDMFKFEMISAFGRGFLNKKPPLLRNKPNLLNLGCAVTTFPDWVNADFFTLAAMLGKRKEHPYWMLDLRHPLNCPPEVWDGVFCEHTLEHLYPLHAFNLLQELYRTMKKGAWVRLSVPDLEKYVSYYSGVIPHENFHQWSTGCEAISYLTQNYHHKSAWDACLLGGFLEKAGFRNVGRTEFKEGTDPSLCKDREGRRWETLYMEAQKTAGPE